MSDGDTADATATPVDDASSAAESAVAASSQAQPSADSSPAANDTATPFVVSANQTAVTQTQVDLGTFVAPDSSSLGSLDHFGVFARTYAPEGSDMEANIAAELFIPNGSDIGASNNVKGLSGEYPLNYFVDVQGLDNIQYQRSDVESTYLVFGPNIALTEKTPIRRPSSAPEPLPVPVASPPTKLSTLPTPRSRSTLIRHLRAFRLMLLRSTLAPIPV